MFGELEDCRADIEFLPTCSKCKKVLWTYVNYEIDNEPIQTRLSSGYVTPSSCPYCKRIFQGIKIQGLPCDNTPKI